MVIRLIREPYGIDSTFGIMFIDGFYQCHSLENTKKIIPAGTYDIEFFPSAKNRMIVPLLKNVPNRSMIEIHPANWFHQLEGCIAPGLTAPRDEQMVTSSRVAMNRLMSKLEGSSNIKIRIEEWA